MADRLTYSEKLMYEVMGAIADVNVPVIYKGRRFALTASQRGSYHEKNYHLCLNTFASIITSRL